MISVIELLKSSRMVGCICMCIEKGILGSLQCVRLYEWVIALAHDIPAVSSTFIQWVCVLGVWLC